MVIRIEEFQLLELASRARTASSRQGYLMKGDQKGKKFIQRWCCIYKNMLFYFESEASAKLLGLVLLEGSECKALDMIESSERQMEVRAE